MKSRWGDEALVDAGWCVSVDFNVGFLLFGDLTVFAFRCKSRDLAGNHRAWGVVWQLMCASVAAWRILKRLYGSQRWWWMCTTLWGNIIRTLPYAAVPCVFGWTLAEVHVLSLFYEKHNSKMKRGCCGSSIFLLLFRLVQEGQGVL